jgi:hypothetical protein
VRSRGTPSRQLGLGGLRYGGRLTGAAARLCRLEREAMEVRATQVLGAHRIATGRGQELLIEGTTRRGGAGGPVGGICPTRLRREPGGKGTFRRWDRHEGTP